MAMSKADRKEIIIGIFVLLGGAALTATSFCVYYLVKPQNMVVLIILCAIDFLYNFFTTCLAYKITRADKWLLKGFLLSAIYVVLFIVVASLIVVFYGRFEALQNNIIGIVFYAFFTGPCILFVMAIILFFLAYGH